MTPDSEKIEAGHSYLVEFRGKDHVFQVHRILEKYGNVFLFVSLYIFLADDAKELQKAPFLCYRDWNHVGEKVEWEEVPLNDVTRVIRPCRIQLSTANEPQSLDVSGPTSDSAELVFLVEWGMSTTEIRKLSNQSGTVEIDSMYLYMDVLSSPLTVHDYNCGIGGSTAGFRDAKFNVAIGVEADDSAAESWKVCPLNGQYLTVSRTIIRE